MDIAKKTVEYLLQIKALKLDLANPFTWASGWKSPVYCDNRKTLSFPEVRTFIRDKFIELIQQKFQQPDLIAGVATGAIAQGALVAQQMELPFVYVRSSSKGHGLQNKIEGVVKQGQKVIVIEDLISTGKSSIKAVEALKNAGCDVMAVFAIFDYGFQQAKDNFQQAGCKLFTLTDYSVLVDVALETAYITAGQVSSLQAWRKSPQTWGKTNLR